MASTTEPEYLVSEAHLLLNEARREKAERTKNVGEPIQLPGKALDLIIRDQAAWIAESTAVARKLDLDTGKILQTYKGHTAPVTCLAFCDRIFASGKQDLLVTGSWDKTIKLWDTKTKELISSTDAHEDFVKTLFVIPSIGLLVSGSSDKIVRFWDISNIEKGKPLSSAGSISTHTRPVECINGKATSDSSAILYTADTMGIMKAWEMVKESGPKPRWKATLKEDLVPHRTRVNELLIGNGQVWTASSDNTIQVIHETDFPEEERFKVPKPIEHPNHVRCILPVGLTSLGEPYILTGSDDVIRVYDISTFEAPELIRQIDDAHWHDITALRLWFKKTKSEDGHTLVEPWVISGSLDGTLRKWRLLDLVSPPPTKPVEKVVKEVTPPPEKQGFELTEDEERELAELMDSD